MSQKYNRNERVNKKFFKNPPNYLCFSLIVFLVEQALRQCDQTGGSGVESEDDIVELDRDLRGLVEDAVLLLHGGDEEEADVEDAVAQEPEAVQDHKVHVQAPHTLPPVQYTGQYKKKEKIFKKDSEIKQVSFSCNFCEKQYLTMYYVPVL